MRSFVAAVLAVTLAESSFVGGISGTGTSTTATIALGAPVGADLGPAFGLTLTLPADVAAFDGRLFVAPGAAELVGLAPRAGGTALTPVESAGGYAFAAYDLAPSSTDAPADARTRVVDVVVAALREGRIQFRLVIDDAADASGRRIELGRSDADVTVAVGAASRVIVAPAPPARATPLHAAGTPGTLRGSLHHARIDRQDLDVARAAWLASRARGVVCAASLTSEQGDANGDGCVDALDLQALLAGQGQPSGMPSEEGAGVSPSAATAYAGTASGTAAYAHTYTVNATADTPDARPGDGVCADSSGRCTLRAAIAESNYQAGPNLIAFNVSATAPVTIQLSGGLPVLTRGGLTIDGYTQPGARVNTSTVGSNAVPGVVVSGNGSSASEVAFYITSSGNTIRGLIVNRIWRGIFMDGANASGNRIVGNWVGFNADGSNSPSTGYGVINNSGANHNVIGTPDLADRNVVGNFKEALENYGTGTNYNTIQDNVLCIGPSGFTTAICDTAVDHDFGPKYELLGGSGTNERNVMGPTYNQGVEYSHGWNPNRAPRQDNSLAWQIDYNRCIGNWIGFRGDGSYDPSFRSAIHASTLDNAQGINVYDGSNSNTVQGNYVASVYDGVTMSSPVARDNVAEGNVIGVSPLGQAAPLTGWGVKAFWNASYDHFRGNTIRNAAKGGFGLVNTNNSGGSSSTAYNIEMSRNIVTDTPGLAIQLFGGANDYVQPPVIRSATTAAISGTSTPGATIEIYHGNRGAGQNGLPDVYIGSTTASSSGAWTFTMPSGYSNGYVITALQTRTDSSTSQLATNVALGGGTTSAPGITSASGTTFAEGVAGSFTVIATGSPTPSIAESGALPSGIAFTDNHNGTATIAGTPASGTAGTYLLTITASNGVSPNAAQAFTLTVSSASGLTTIASDTFSRTLAGSWGSANVGGAWTLLGTSSSFGVNGAAGTISVPAGNTRGAWLGSASAASVTLATRIARDRTAAGGSQYAYLVARRIDASTEYRAKIRFGTDGAVYVQATRVAGGIETSLGIETKIAGLSPAAGAFTRFEATFSGTSPTSIGIKAWADGSAEPPGWAYTATDSTPALQVAGSVGVKAYVSSATSNGPVTLSVDDFSAARLS